MRRACQAFGLEADCGKGLGVFQYVFDGREPSITRSSANTPPRRGVIGTFFGGAVSEIYCPALAAAHQADDEAAYQGVDN